jgi:uncharacterized protein YciI
MHRLISLTLLLCPFAGFAQDSSHTYYIAFLRPDPARPKLSKDEGERIQAAHMANIRRMADARNLAAAGPFDDDPPTISGVFVMNAPSLAEAERIAAEDPTVVEHRNSIDVHAWRGPAGIGAEYFRLHKADPKTLEGMGIQPFCLLKRGPAWNSNARKRARLFEAHHDYIEGLRRKDKLGAAGATESDSDLLGVVIFKRIDFEEARRLMEQDPAVKSGFLAVDYHKWWSAEHVLPW